MVDQLQTDSPVAQYITTENRGLAASIVRTALDECLSSIAPGATPGDGRNAWSDVRYAYGADIAVLHDVPNTMGSLLWRRIADFGLANGMDQTSLLAAADALFAHLCRLRGPRP
ncbi:hypothetical protein ABTX61_08390 [Amycolatopsis japonica]|uniref:hypothetical protein n=1 Tax=Amycolatopsis japonica TaxID=208439 RepID=UPI0033178A12